MSHKPIDVVVSHCAIDRGLAQLVASTLTSAGMKVWMSADHSTGRRWQDLVRDAMLRAKTVIVLLTRNSLKSSHAAFEVGMAMGAEKPIFVLYEGVSTDELPEYAHQHRVADMSQLPEIINEIKSLRVRSSDLAVTR